MVSNAHASYEPDECVSSVQPQMKFNENPLFTWNENDKAELMVCQLYGALDAGNAAQLAVHQILSALPAKRIATFNSDHLIDYRSRRPIVSVENWIVSDMEVPQIALDMITDYRGHKMLLLHGPEPDFGWEIFGRSVVDIARQCGVERSLDLMSMPAAMPHTRRCLVHETAVESDALPEQSGQPGPITISASAGIYLQRVLGDAGITARGLITGVPYYLADSEYPLGAVALVQRIADMADMELPIGDLEAVAAVMRHQVDKQVADNAEMEHLVAVLEQNYDVGALANAVEIPKIAQQTASGDEIAQRLEEFLRRHDELNSVTTALADETVDTAESKVPDYRSLPPRRNRRKKENHS